MSRLVRPLALAATIGLPVLGLAACGSDSEDSAGTRELTVFAAASLRDTFTTIGAEFTAQNPGVTVRFNFAGSSDLVAQLQEGAPADLFASADTRNMDKAVAGGVVSAAPNPLPPTP